MALVERVEFVEFEKTFYFAWTWAKILHNIKYFYLKYCKFKYQKTSMNFNV